MTAYPVPIIPHKRGRFADNLQLDVWEAELRAGRLPPHVLDVARVVHAARFPAPRPQLRMLPRRMMR